MPQPLETVSETSVTVTITVSGLSFWLSKDPIGVLGGVNQYAFCGNSPVNFRDPFGLCEKREYKVLDGNKILNDHLQSVIDRGFPRGYFQDKADPKIVYSGNILFMLNGVLYTPSEIGNIAAARTAYLRGGNAEFLAVKYGGEAPLWWDWSGFSQGWNVGWGILKPTTSLFLGAMTIIEGASGSWDLNNVGRAMGGRQ